eukprot:9486159-Alexandrium_andersonii.AAC.1
MKGCCRVAVVVSCGWPMALTYASTDVAATRATPATSSKRAQAVRSRWHPVMWLPCARRTMAA